MNRIIPKNTVLVLSGVACVGKTTAAYGLIKRCSDFRRVSELDIIRTIVRATLTDTYKNNYLTRDFIMEHYSPLFKSLSVSDFETAKRQSQALIPYVQEIILRQQQRNISTVLEGAGIIPSTYFPKNKPLYWLNNTVIFINLHLSDEIDHINRRQARCDERDYTDSYDDTKRKILEIRNYNTLLHEETLELSNRFKNVFSMDISGKSSDSVVDTILYKVKKYFSEL